MPRVLFLMILFSCVIILNAQEVDKKKLGTAIYVNSIITVKAPAGTVKELINQITLQNKGIPAIDANAQALLSKIPTINAESVRMGIFLIALDNYYDAATETLLSVTTDNQVVYIKGQTLKMIQKNSEKQTKEEFTLSKYPKSEMIKAMLDSKALEQVAEKIKTQFELTTLTCYEEKTEDSIYLFGSLESTKILEKYLNKIEVVWLQDKNKKFLEILEPIIKKDQIETVELKIKENEKTISVYNIHKNNLFDKLNKPETNQKEVLAEIENLKTNIENCKALIKKLTADLDKLKK
jgi:hypothetical protein